MNQSYICTEKMEHSISNQSVYKNLARELLDKIEGQSFFNGSIQIESEGCLHTLRVTLIIYRAPSLDPAYKSGPSTHVTDIVPVWWELISVDQSGVVNQDLNWGELREFLF